ncbi:monoamine regulon transcriptional regulator [Vibrio maritimus]|uniref:Monoamine regulon transcriptional regulator n=1 Tax=Vibrio maritimus TaxID=990268 RepID=A0A090SW08_9VIBR|nr:monoamine regulon transcriptional regulator [Vibrio maritimus]
MSVDGTCANLVQLNEFQNEMMLLLDSSMKVSRLATYLVDERARPICYQTSKIQPLMHQQYVDDFYQADPLYPENFSSPRDRIIKMSDLVSPMKQRTHAYYQDFIKPWKVNEIVELYFYHQNNLIGGAALFFDQAVEAPSKNDLIRLGSLHRYIEFSLGQQLKTVTKMSFDDFCDQYLLTSKERVVLQLAIQGLANKVMAQKLNCSLSTIKTHLQHLFSKLEVNSKVEMVNLVYSSKCII